MNLSKPTSPIFAHSDNKIYVSDVDTYLDCKFEITTKTQTKEFNNKVYAYNGMCEIDLAEICKLFYYKLFQPLPVSNYEVIDGTNFLNGGELKITLIDASQNTEILNFKVINGALQIGETFDSNENQYLNQIRLQFIGFPSDTTEWKNGEIIRKNSNSFPAVKKCKGIYMAWMNKYGAYDYYLFDGYSEMDIDSRDVEKFNGYSLGKKSNRVIKIRANVIEDLNLYTIQKLSPNNSAKQITEALISIIESPEVYIFRVSNHELTTGGDFNIDFNNDFLTDPYFKIEGDFIKVKSISGNNKIKFRYNTTAIDFDVTLPDEKNILAI